MLISHEDHKNHENKRINENIQHTVEKTVEAYKMLQTGDSVLVGVSGGSDSMVLLYVLIELAPRLHLRLGVAHLNHSLRQEDSDDDAEFVASIARQLDLPNYIQKMDVRSYQKINRLSLEEAARQVRYNFYDVVAATNGYNKIALGHHSDDNAELILMHIFRGSGPRGVSGIPPIRGDKIIRPLIDLKKAEILDFLARKKIAYISDLSNEDTQYLRNRIRHNLIPSLISSYNPRIVETLIRMASITRAEEDWIEDMLNPIFEESVIEANDNKIILSAQRVDELHIAAKRRVFRRAIARAKGDLKRISFSHIESAIRLLKKEPGYGCLDLPDRIRIYLEGNNLVICKERYALRELKSDGRKSTTCDFEYSLLKPGVIFIKETNTHIRFSVLSSYNLPECFCDGHQVAFVDMDNVDFPLIVRNVRSGDRFTPLGMSGSQKVNRFFSNKKIPKNERTKCPVLTDGEGKIIWVAGHRIDEFFRVLSSSKNILKIELFLA